MKVKDLKIIGNQEWCTFPELKIPAIRARIDSGAKTSSIQATEIKLIKKNDDSWVRFVVNPLQRNEEIKLVCRAKLVGKRSIKGSFGIAEERLIIKSPITIGEDTFDIELSLANRNTMEFRMLLGRDSISGRYIINPATKHVQQEYTRKELNAMYKPGNKVKKTAK